jgi:hypothetical protein
MPPFASWICAGAPFVLIEEPYGATCDRPAAVNSVGIRRQRPRRQRSDGGEQPPARRHGTPLDFATHKRSKLQDKVAVKLTAVREGFV